MRNELKMKMTLPDDMEIPENNRDLSSMRNVRWLLRNLAVRNSTHPCFKTVMKNLTNLAKENL
jgi:hypothetical protein